MIVVATITIYEYTNNPDPSKSTYLCKRPFFIYERVGGVITAIVFWVIGYLIAKRIKKQARITKYDHEI